MTYVFAAAGTGGHVYPALAVADALLEAGIPRQEILFVGGNRMEATTVPESGYDFFAVDIRGLKRSLSLHNLTLPAKVRRASQQLQQQFEWRNSLVVATFGGYIAVPAALAARRTGASLIVHEQNAVPGIANRLIGRRANDIYVAFPETLKQLKNGKVIGNPLRRGLANFSRAALRGAALERYGLPDGVPVLGILGGSLGAKILNEAGARVIDSYKPDELSVLHLTGERHYEDVMAAAKSSYHVWQVRAFEDQMEYFYAACDLLLARAGALTVAEIAATATPAVVVPYRTSTGGHQAANAARSAAVGGLAVIDQEDIDSVPAVVQQLLADTQRRRSMQRAAEKESRPHAARVLAERMMDMAR